MAQSCQKNYNEGKKMNKKNLISENGASVFARSKSLIEQDPLEEIFALNLGDFITEHLISDEFAQKIANSKQNNKAENLKKQLSELVSIYSINNTLNVLGLEQSNGSLIYNSIAKTISNMVDCDCCHIFLYKNYDLGASKHLCLVGSSNDSVSDIYSKPIEKFDSCLKKQIEEILNQKSYLEFRNGQFQLQENQQYSYTIAFSMHNSFETVGLVCLQKKESKDFRKEYIVLMQVTGRLFAISMYIQKLINEVKVTIEDKNISYSKLQHLRAELTSLICDLGVAQQNFVETLAKNVNSKMKYSTDHCQQVADLSKSLCSHFKLNEKTTDLIYYAGLLQNIGKMILPKNVFEKSSQFSSKDFEKLNRHNNLGLSLLMNINFLSEIVPYIMYKTERFDGSGLPEGLKGNSIPFGSRIIAVADAFCALTSNRPHREKLSHNEALQILEQESGKKWDPDVVNALKKIVLN